MGALALQFAPDRRLAIAALSLSVFEALAAVLIYGPDFVAGA